MDQTIELPAVFQQAEQAPARPKKPLISPEARAERLKGLGEVIAQKRDAAVKARKKSGIEEIWMACEEAYLGIDEANRADFAKARWAKPTTMSGPLTTGQSQTSGNKSTAYVRLTTRYVDMGAAKISEITLPIDDKAFSLDATPVPDLVKLKKDKTPIRNADGSMVWRQARDEEMATLIQSNPAAAFMGAGDGMQPQVPVTKGDVAQAQLQQAKDAAKKAETRIYDWMVEARYPMQMRKVIHDAARIGVGVLKGPFPDERISRAYTKEAGLVIDRSVSPSCKWVDPWNIFPHGSCGEDIHSGDYMLERDFMSPSGLGALKNHLDLEGQPIYLASQIDKVIAEGPDKCNTAEGANPNEPKDKERFAIWHFCGTLTREDMEMLGAPGVEDLPDAVTQCYAIVTLVNDSPIRATFNPLEKSGHYPYRVFQWSRRAGSWAGVGVGEQVSLPQKMVNAGTRSWLNNAGISSGIQLFIDRNKLTSSDGSDEITPNKVWEITAEGAGDDIRTLFGSIEIPNRGKELMEIINYAFKLAEEQSNIPLISQGQTGPNDPQTFGQAELQNNNANTLLRQQAANLDDSVTEPLVGDFYEWLLLDDNIPADEKGDFKIDARGSTAMVEKAIQEATLAMLGGMVKDPAYGMDPKRWASEFVRSKRLDPERLQYSEEEIEAMKNQPPPEAPQVQAAKINAATTLHVQEMRGQSNERIAQGRDQTTLQRTQVDTDRDTVYVQAESERARIAAQAAEAKRQQDYELALIKFAEDRQMNLADAKTELAKTAMELRTQIRLASVNGKAPQVATPAIEPAGRAPEGEAFQK